VIPAQIDLSQWGGIAVALLPELFLTAWALVLTLVSAWQHKTREDVQLVGRLALAGLVVTLALVVAFWIRAPKPAGLELMIALDGFRWAVSSVFLLGAIFAVALSLHYLGREQIVVPEYYVLLLLATLGTMFMGSGADLIVIFLGLELMSVSVYVLAGINRRSIFAAEASLKYFLLGAFASGFLLYGIALLYGATGTTNLTMMYIQIADLALQSNTMLVAGVALLVIGFAFKVAAVPFHMWTPDVYDGAPTPVTAYMAAAVKAAAFAALTRVLVQALAPVSGVWTEVIWWLAAITMIAGNVIALAQRHLKRMLAYSSIGHAGYLLTAVASGTDLGTAALLYYVLVYTLMTVGAFAVLSALGRGGERDTLIEDFNGLASRRPWLALAMTVFLLSLLGFPGTAGFIGKWYILSAAVSADQVLLAVILVGASILSAGYYLPVIMAMYMKPAESEEAHAETRVLGAARWVIGIAAVLLLLFGVWPNRVLDLARREGRDLRPAVMITVSR
jgi:NADH-quinone oxidoreductase subunit N